MANDVEKEDDTDWEKGLTFSGSGNEEGATCFYTLSEYRFRHVVRKRCGDHWTAQDKEIGIRTRNSGKKVFVQSKFEA